MGRQSFAIGEFSKGLDLISSPNAIEPGYTPSAMNVRCCEYGGFEKILGYAAFADLGSGVAGHDVFYYETAAGGTERLVVASATKWQAIQSDGTSMTDMVTGLNSVTETTFVQYGDTLYGLSRSNNMRSSSNMTSTTEHAPGVDTGPPQGLILGIWSNRMWTTSGGSVVRWSDAGNFTSSGAWPAANTVTLGGTGAGSSYIVGGIPTELGLLVFTKDATYLITDTDGTNRLVDGEHGCSSRRSICRVDELIYGINSEGIFRTNGNQPLELVSRQVDPLFTSENPTLSGAAGVMWKNAYFVSFQRELAYNDLTLDVKPAEGSIMANQYRAHCWARGPIANSGEQLFFIDAGNTRYVRKAFSGGSFLSTASPGVAADIPCWYETPPLDLGSEDLVKRLHRIRIVGRGDVYVGARVDYAQYNSLANRFAFPSITESVYDTAVYDTATYGGYTLFEGHVNLPVRGRRIGLRFFESSSNTYPGRPNLDSDTGPDTSGAAVFLAEPTFSTSSKRRYS